MEAGIRDNSGGGKHSVMGRGSALSLCRAYTWRTIWTRNANAQARLADLERGHGSPARPPLFGVAVDFGPSRLEAILCDLNCASEANHRY